MKVCQKFNKSYDMVPPFLISFLCKSKIANLELQKSLLEITFPAENEKTNQNERTFIL